MRFFLSTCFVRVCVRNCVFLFHFITSISYLNSALNNKTATHHLSLIVYSVFKMWRIIGPTQQARHKLAGTKANTQTVRQCYKNLLCHNNNNYIISSAFLAPASVLAKGISVNFEYNCVLWPTNQNKLDKDSLQQTCRPIGIAVTCCVNTCASAIIIWSRGLIYGRSWWWQKISSIPLFPVATHPLRSTRKDTSTKRVHNHWPTNTNRTNDPNATTKQHAFTHQWESY